MDEDEAEKMDDNFVPENITASTIHPLSGEIDGQEKVGNFWANNFTLDQARFGGKSRVFLIARLKHRALLVWKKRRCVRIVKSNNLLVGPKQYN